MFYRSSVCRMFQLWSNECHVRLNDVWHPCTIWITGKLIQESLRLIYSTLVLKRIWRVLCVLCFRMTEPNSLVVMGTLVFLGKVSFCLSAGAVCLSLSSISCRLSLHWETQTWLCAILELWWESGTVTNERVDDPPDRRPTNAFDQRFGMIYSIYICMHALLEFDHPCSPVRLS